MVKSKKMSKTSIAVIVLALLLVLSMVMGITGAWFTDYEKQNEVSTFKFGEVEMNVGSIAVSYVHEDGTTPVGENDVMPGDKIKINLTAIAKTAESEDFWYKVKVSIAPQNGSDALTTAAQTALEAANAGLYCTKAGVAGAATLADILVDLSGDAFGNDYQGDSYKITLEFRALQLENVDATEAAALLSDTPAQGLVWEVNPDGITKVQNNGG